MRGWIRSDEAAVALGVTIKHMWVIAHRKEWRRLRHRGTTWYHLDDVIDERVRRDANVGASR